MTHIRNMQGKSVNHHDQAAINRVELQVFFPQVEVGAVSPAERIIEMAASLGHQAIGLIGFDEIQSFLSAEKTAKRFGIKPIFGLQAALIIDGGRTINCCVYAKNERGKKSLYKLISLSDRFNSESGVSVPMGVFESNREGLIVSSGPGNLELYDAVLQRPQGDAEELARYYDLLSIEPWNTPEQSTGSNTYSSLEWQQINRGICELGDRSGRLVIAAGNVRGISQAEDGLIWTTDEMIREFNFLGAEKAYEVVVKNTNELAGQIDTFELVPNNLHLPRMEGDGHQIRSLCYEKAQMQYGVPLPQKIEDRLDREVDLICDHGFAFPYLIAERLVRKSKEDGYPVGTRGSVGASVVAYFLGISDTNPLPPHHLCQSCSHIEWMPDGSAKSGFDGPDKTCSRCGEQMRGDGHNIPFEMFLGFRGNKMPDIDLNMAGEYQAKAHAWVKEFLGDRNVLIAGRANGAVHPGGLLLIPDHKEAEDFTPVIDASSEDKPGWRKSYFDYRHLERSLYKFDILGHDDPSMMRLLHSMTGVDPDAIPMNDNKVLSLFRSTQELGVTAEQILTGVATYGLPEMGTLFVRQMLEETQPETFSDLVQISGLSHGTGVWEGNAKELIRIGVCSLQIAIGLRDDVMQTLIGHGLHAEVAFRISDSVRKGIALSGEEIGEMTRRNVPEWYIESCQKIKYLFPKAHAVTYVRSAIRHAFYKLYYPLEFYAAYFTVKSADSDLMVCYEGYEAIRSRLLELPEPQPLGTASAKGVLEVALEMSARGIRIVKGTSGGGEFSIEGMNRRIVAGSSEVLDQLNV